MKKIILSIFICLTLSFSIIAQSVVVLKDNTSLRTENATGGTVWAMEVLSGLKLELLSPEPVSKDLVTSKETTPNISFYHVKYQGKEYYIRENEATIGTTVGVTTAKSVLFTNPRLSDFRNAYLEPGTIISCGKTVTQNGLKFVEIEFYDTSAWTKRTRYVLQEDISKNAADIEAIQLVQKVLSLNDKNLQKELLESAKQLKVCTEIFGIIYETEQNLFPTDFTENDIELYSDITPSGRVFTEDGAKVNIRAFPSTGDVVGQIETNTSIVITGKTTKTQTIEGLTACWYKIAPNGTVDFPEGWVFGGYVIFNE